MDGASTRILCIDDDCEVVESYRAVLEKGGYEVVVACDGDAGVAEARRRKPDLIILDVMMRDMTEGFHVSYTLDADAVLRDVPVLMLTGIGSELNTRFNMTKGGPYLPVDAFLDKPVAPDTLLETVERLLSLPTAEIAIASLDS